MKIVAIKVEITRKLYPGRYVTSLAHQVCSLQQGGSHLEGNGVLTHHSNCP